MLDRDGPAGTWRHTDPRRRLRRQLRRQAAQEAGRDDRQPRELHAVRIDAAGGRFRHAGAAPRRRPTTADVPARRPRARARGRPRARPPARPGRDRGRTPQHHLSRSRCRARRDSADVPDPGPRRIRLRLQGSGRHDRTAQSRLAAPRSGRGGAKRCAQAPRADLRLRRCRLRRSRGAGGALGPGPRRAALLPGRRPDDAPALGARRRGAEDPPGDPSTAGRIRSRAAGAPGRRHPRQHDAGGGRTTRGRALRRRPHSGGTVVWTTGARPNPLLAKFGLPLDDFGRVKVDSTFRVEGLPNLLALGDCARVPNEATPERPDPPTSQHALRQARRLAKNLRGDPKPYRYRMLGQVATLGRRKGIAEVLGLKFRGFLGWWITRTYHLYQLPLFSRKLRVVTDWTVALLFRRDIAELSMLGHRHRLGDE